ncbi:MAG: hypothetical protein AB7L76_10955, partial [Burkholderiaceae bacterium]
APVLPEQTFFNDPVTDRLMGVTLTLAAELQMLRERVRDLEIAMAGGAAPSPAEREAERRADASAFVAHVLGPLLGEQQAKGPL